MIATRTPDPTVGLVAAAAAGADSWEQLASAARACTACPELVAARQHVVVGVAPPGARVLMVGEAPGAAEDDSGLPFVGKSGQLLDRLLTDAGLDRAQVAVANVLKCRPPANRTPTAAEAARCRGWLDRQVELVDPDYVVTLGSSAVGWALGRGTRITAVRGRLHPLHAKPGGRPVLATYHPSAAIRFGPRGAPLAALRADLAHLARLLLQPGPAPAP